MSREEIENEIESIKDDVNKNSENIDLIWDRLEKILEILGGNKNDQS